MLTPSDHSEQLIIDQSRSRLRRRPTSGLGGGPIEQGIVTAMCFAALTRSAVLMVLLIIAALAMTACARSRP